MQNISPLTLLLEDGETKIENIVLDTGFIRIGSLVNEFFFM